ncbi:hypothetical protein B0H16DRAFT_1744278 [Mycena metata]|uniref:Uncharacterized protein n=1 Tax=Mycena metata TaxID=1033252 RepID=A0AAD7H569_9AGAR|nr:hypothetical protein B0H16DRAFT_1744278 [Mycena metata]
MAESTIEYTDRAIRRANDRLGSRSEFMLKLRYEHSVRPMLAPLLEGPVINPYELPVVNISDSEEYSSESDSNTPLSPSPSPPPEKGTPPPSYPGTPEPAELAAIMGRAEAPTSTNSDDELWKAVESGIANIPARNPRLAAMHVHPDDGDWDDMPELVDNPSEPEEAQNPEDTGSLAGFANGTPNAFSFFDDRGREETFARMNAALDREAAARIEYRRPFPGSRPHESAQGSRFALSGDLNWAAEIANGEALWNEMHSGPPARIINDLASEPTDLIGSNFPSHVDEATATGTYEIVDHSRAPLEPRPEDDCILRSVVMVAPDTAEQFLTFVDRNGNIYVRNQPLPDHHFLNPEFRAEHDAAMCEAIEQRMEELCASPNGASEHTDFGVQSGPTWDRRGFPDTSPRLLPGDAFHERLVSLDPEDDLEEAYPGYRVQFLSQRVELLSNDLACLSAQVEIAGTKAYILFDSGSNIDSLTPKYAKATGCKSILLQEQITLQLGCVGSKSKISYGTRPPVNFGGILGHVYFDIANLDRYDGRIGTSFMNKHGIILDFGKREIRFPNDRVVKALSSMEEAALLVAQQTDKAPRSTTSTD